MVLLLPLIAGSIVLPFWGSYFESHKIIPKSNYYGACGYRALQGTLKGGQVPKVSLGSVFITGPALGAGCLCLLGRPMEGTWGKPGGSWDFGTGVIVWVNYSYSECQKVGTWV